MRKTILILLSCAYVHVAQALETEQAVRDVVPVKFFEYCGFGYQSFIVYANGQLDSELAITDDQGQLIACKIPARFRVNPFG